MRRYGIAIGVGLVALATSAAWGSTVIGLSIEDQARLSEFVAVGQVVQQRGVEHPANGIETEITLVVTDVLKGDVHRGDRVVFHTRGGQVDEEISEAVGEASFRTGQRALVFVERVDGRPYLLGLSMGAWDVQEDTRGHTSFTRALRDGLEIFGGDEIERGPIGLRDMTSRVGWTARHPEFDHPMLRDAALRGR